MKKQRKPRTILLNYLARVEGETDLVLTTGARGVAEVKLKIWEPPRFFERFLVGRKYDEAGDIVARICGICPISHMTASLLAVEDAMGVETSLQTKQLRKVMCSAQIASSHVVHLYMLVLPDYFGYPGFVQMMPDFEEETRGFLRLKEVLNRVGDVIGGRALHPISMVVNGFTRMPAKRDLMALAGEIREALPLARDAVLLMSRLPQPDLKAENEFVALRPDAENLYGEGRLVSSRGLDAAIRDYPLLFQERQEDYAMAKKSTITRNGNPFMVGALARVNLNYDRFHAETKALVRETGFTLPDLNPFHNVMAQALEIYNEMIECMKILSDLNPEHEKPLVKVREGEGIAVTEAPRGLLMHSYSINRKGVIEKANLVTPTSHNFANMEKDLRLLASQYPDDDYGDLKLKCEKLIRAYDPCFSCSVH